VIVTSYVGTQGGKLLIYAFFEREKELVFKRGRNERRLRPFP